MAMVVQHNMTAANANRMLGTTSSAQAKSAEKVSSNFTLSLFSAIHKTSSLYF